MGFARENIRLEKDVLSKLGVRERKYKIFFNDYEIISGHRTIVCFSNG